MTTFDLFTLALLIVALGLGALTLVRLAARRSRRRRPGAGTEAAGSEYHRSHTQSREQERDLLQQIEALQRWQSQARALWEVLEAASTQADFPAALRTAAERLDQELALSHVLVADASRQDIHLIVAPARLSARDALQALMEEPNPLRAARDLKGPLVLSDLRRDEAWSRSPLLRVLQAASAVILPLHLDDGWSGVLLLVRGAGDPPFEPECADLYAHFGGQLAATLAKTRMLHRATQRLTVGTQDLEREHERTETLLRITSELSSSLDLEHVLDRALALVIDAVGADRGVILLPSSERDVLILRAQLGADEPLPHGGRPAPFKHDEGLAGWVIAHRQPVIIPDLTRDERWIPYSDPIAEHKSALAVPLLVSEDALGALLLLSHRRGAFDEGQLSLVTAAANQVAAAINNAELYRLIRDQAERLGSMLRAQQVEASKSRAILESIADGVIVTDPDHRVVLFNSAAERILGLKRDEALGRPAVDFIGLYGPAGRRWVAAVQGWSQTPPQAGADQALLDERLMLEDERVVSVHLAPVVFEKDFLGTVSIFRDITREVELDRLKSEFVATVSHELRTPMTSIKGYVEVLLMGAVGPLSDEQRRFLEIIKTNTDRLGILVNDLLDVSRIEAGKIHLTMQRLRVEDLVREARAYIERRIAEESKPMHVHLDLPGGLPHVRGDPERVRQVITNLVDNSFNYTPAGGNITLRARLRNGEVEIEVADDGIGIPPTDQDRVFERFFRGEQALDMAVAGTGLGLSIVKQLVEMHGGRIWMTSEGAPGEGTTFTFTLPIAEGIPATIGAED